MSSVVDIGDPADERLDDFRDLNSVDRRPDLPTGKGLVIAEGVLVVQRMLASRFRPRAMLGTDRRLHELAADLGATDAPYYRVTAEVMADVVGFHLNRGVLAAAPRPGELTVDKVLHCARTVAVLEGVNDHENLGSIFRNAAGLGVDAVVFGTGCADPLYRRAVRVSMGHALLVPYAWATAWPGDLTMLRDKGFRVLAMTPDPTAPTLSEAMPTVGDGRVAILVGAEGPGLTETAMRTSDVRVRIPMSRGTDSLNVATAAALAFYERVRLVRAGWGHLPLAGESDGPTPEGQGTTRGDNHVSDDATPWGTGLTVAGFVAAVTAGAVVVLSLGLVRVHPLLAVGLNLVAVGGLAPTVWGWRRTPVLRWFVLGLGVGVAGAWLALLALILV